MDRRLNPRMKYNVNDTAKDVLREMDTVFWNEYSQSNNHSSRIQRGRKDSMRWGSSRGVNGPMKGIPFRDRRSSNSNSDSWAKSEAAQLLAWFTSFFDHHISAEEQEFRLFFLQRNATSMTVSLLLNAFMLLAIYFYFIPFKSLASYSAPVSVHLSIWMLLTVLCLSFVAVYRFAPHWFLNWTIDGHGSISSSSINLNSSNRTKSAILSVWMELGRAILCVRMVVLVMRIAHYGTYLPGSNISGAEVSLCLDTMDFDLSNSSGDNSFTYMYLRALIDVSEAFIFCSFPFAAPWAVVLGLTEMTSQTIRLLSCADRITTDPTLHWLIVFLQLRILLIFILVVIPSPLMMERSVRSIFCGLQWQSEAVAECRKLVHLLVSEVKVPIINLQHMIASLVKDNRISATELARFSIAKAAQQSSDIITNKTVAFIAEIRQAVQEVLSVSDNLLLLMRVQEGQYRFDVNRDVSKLLDAVTSALLCAQSSFHTADSASSSESTSAKHQLRLMVDSEQLGVKNSSRQIPVVVNVVQETVYTDKFCLSAVLRELLNASCWVKILSETHSESNTDDVVRMIYLDVEIRSDDGTSKKKRQHSSIDGLDSTFISIRIDHYLQWSLFKAQRLQPRDVLCGQYLAAKHLVCRRLLGSAAGSSFKAQGWVQEGTTRVDDPDSGASEKTEVGESMVIRWSISIPCRLMPTVTTAAAQGDDVASTTAAVATAGDSSSNADIVQVLLLSQDDSNSAESITSVLQQMVDVAPVAFTLSAGAQYNNSSVLVVRSELAQMGLHPLPSRSTTTIAAALMSNTSTSSSYPHSLPAASVAAVKAALEKYRILAVDSAEQCRQLRSAPYFFRGKLILFSYNIAFIEEQDMRLADLVLPVCCDNSDVGKLKAWYQTFVNRQRHSSELGTTLNSVAARGRRANREATIDEVQSNNQLNAAQQQEQESSDKTGTAVGNIVDHLCVNRSVLRDEAYTRWRLLNPTRALFHHTTVPSVLIVVTVAFKFSMCYLAGVSVGDVALESTPSVVYFLRDYFYDWMVKPLRLSMNASLLALLSVGLLSQCVILYLLAFDVPIATRSNSDLSGFLNSEFGSSTGKSFVLDITVSIWLSYIFFFPPPLHYPIRIFNAATKGMLLFGIRSMLGTDVTNISALSFAFTTLHLLLAVSFFEESYREEYMTLHQRLMSISFYDTAVQDTLPRLHKPMKSLLDMEKSLFESSIRHVLSQPAASLGSSLQERQPFSRAALQVSLAVTKLEFFDATTSAEVCSATAEVCLRNEVMLVLQMLRLAYGRTFKMIGLKLQLTVDTVLTLVRLNVRLFHSILLESCSSVVDAFEKQQRSATGTHLTSAIHIIVSSNDRTFLADIHSSDDNGGSSSSQSNSRNFATAKAKSAKVPMFHDVRKLKVQILCTGLSRSGIKDKQQQRMGFSGSRSRSNYHNGSELNQAVGVGSWSSGSINDGRVGSNDSIISSKMRQLHVIATAASVFTDRNTHDKIIRTVI